MHIELRSPLRKLIFAAVSLVAVALYVRFAFRAFLAAHLAASLDAQKIRRAIQLEPHNAEYPHLLGRSLALSGTTLDDAISAYRISVRLNPYDARSWLDLAGAYQFAGRNDEQGDSVEKAAKADPATPHVAWEAGNFFLLQGQTEKALGYFRTVLANDPETVDSTLRLCMRATGDVDKVLDLAIPPNPDVYLSFLRLVIAMQDVSGAENVWNHLIALRRPFSAQPALPYFRFLIAERDPIAAKTAWEHLAAIDASIKPYLASADNLVVNGGFEHNMLNGGFDWWYNTHLHAVPSLDDVQFRSGARSLNVTFDGQSVPGAPILQYIPVKPNTSYQFSAECRSEDIDTASGPRFAIVDAYTNASYVLTDDTLGTTPWRLHQAQFKTGPNTNLVLLEIIRDPAAPLIRGKFWVDNVKLVEVSNQGF